MKTKLIANMKKKLSLLMAVVMLFAIIAIFSPEKVQAKATDPMKSTLNIGDHLYLGINSRNKLPISWKIVELDDKDPSNPIATLLSDNLLEYRKYDSVASNHWYYSEICNYLNSTSNHYSGIDIKGNPYSVNYDYTSNGFLTNSFTRAAQNAIVDKYSTVSDDTYNDNLEVITPSQKIVIPSIIEYWNWQNAPARMDATPLNHKGINGGNASGYYWLRSPKATDPFNSWYILKGSSSFISVSFYLGVRPAFKLNLSSVTFTSEIKDLSYVTPQPNDTLQSYDTVSDRDYILHKTGKTYKIGILDSDMVLTNITQGTNSVTSTSILYAKPMETLNLTTDITTTSPSTVMFRIKDSTGAIVNFGAGSSSLGSNINSAKVGIPITDFTRTNGLELGSYTVDLWLQKDGKGAFDTSVFPSTQSFNLYIISPSILDFTLSSTNPTTLTSDGGIVNFTVTGTSLNIDNLGIVKVKDNADNIIATSGVGNTATTNIFTAMLPPNKSTLADKSYTFTANIDGIDYNKTVMVTVPKMETFPLETNAVIGDITGSGSFEEVTQVQTNATPNENSSSSGLTVPTEVEIENSNALAAIITMPENDLTETGDAPGSGSFEEVTQVQINTTPNENSSSSGLTVPTEVEIENSNALAAIITMPENDLTETGDAPGSGSFEEVTQVQTNATPNENSSSSGLTVPTEVEIENSNALAAIITMPENELTVTGDATGSGSFEEVTQVQTNATPNENSSSSGLTVPTEVEIENSNAPAAIITMPENDLTETGDAPPGSGSFEEVTQVQTNATPNKHSSSSGLTVPTEVEIENSNAPATMPGNDVTVADNFITTDGGSSGGSSTSGRSSYVAPKKIPADFGKVIDDKIAATKDGGTVMLSTGDYESIDITADQIRAISDRNISIEVRAQKVKFIIPSNSKIITNNKSLKVNIQNYPVKADTTNYFNGIDKMNSTLLNKTNSSIQVLSNGKIFETNGTVKYNLSEFELTAEQISNLVAVKTSFAGKHTDLYGTYDKKTKTFIVQVEKTGNYGVAIEDSNNLPNEPKHVVLVVGSTNFNVNDKVSSMEVAPVIVDDTTYVPLRSVSEAIGAKIDWNADTNTATISEGGKTIDIVSGNDNFIKNDRMMVPLRYIRENLGAVVTWDGDTQTIDISKK